MRPLWFDQTVAATTVASSVKFDTLTGAYQLSKLREGSVHWAEQTQKEDEMRCGSPSSSACR